MKTTIGVAALCLSTLLCIRPARAQTPEFMIDFRNPAHRAQTLEDGLEFIATYPAGNNPRWALYLVTSGTPRIYFPGAVVPVDSNDYHHMIRICTAGGYFTDRSGEVGTGIARIQLRGNKVAIGETQSVDSKFGEYAASATPWGTCQADGDRGGGFGTMEPVDGVYVEVEAYGENTEVPIGSVIPLRMVAIGNGLNPVTDGHDWPPQLCCESELDCTVEPYCGDGVKSPWEVCDDGNNIPGDGCSADCSMIEPPGGGPGPVEPPGGGPGPVEPPGTSNGQCGDGVVDVGEVCDHGGAEFSNCLDDCSGYLAEPAGRTGDPDDSPPQACQLNVTHRAAQPSLFVLVAFGLAALMRRRRSA